MFPAVRNISLAPLPYIQAQLGPRASLINQPTHSLASLPTYLINQPLPLFY